MTTQARERAAKKAPSINDWTGLGGKKSLEQISKLFRIVYVAGPMTGYENFNFPAFDQGRDYVNGINENPPPGFSTNVIYDKGSKAPRPIAGVSPADMDRAHGFDEISATQTPVGAVVSTTFFFDCMRRDMEVVSRAFAILLMKGWKASRGANNELFFARQCGVEVWIATYDVEGNIIGHVEAPEWLRSPLIYGDDGNPALNEERRTYSVDGVSHTPSRVTAQYEPQNDRLAVRQRYAAPLDPDTREAVVVSTEVDQTLSELPAEPGKLDYQVSHLYPTSKIPNSPPANILQEAEGLIFGERNADYGHPIEDFSRTGKMWAGVLRDWALTVTDPQHVPDVPPELVGLSMVLVKVSREVNKHKRDNLVDISGYAGTLDMIADYRAEHSENPATS